MIGGGKTIRLKQTIGIVLLLGSLVPRAVARQRPINVGRSRLLVTVYKSGLFSVLAHNHEIEAPISSGTVATGPSLSVELKIATDRLHVLDPGLDAQTRSQIRDRMLGPQVLDATRFPIIQFVSRHVTAAGPSCWTVVGDLTLHGRTRPLTIDVTQSKGAYTGSVTFRQSDFGITPIRIAGGTVRVKDMVRVRFKVYLRNPPQRSAPTANSGP